MAAQPSCHDLHEDLPVQAAWLESVGGDSKRATAVMSMSALFDGAKVTLFDGSRSRSRALLRRAGMGIGYQREIT